MIKPQLIYYLQGMQNAYELEGETGKAEVVEHILQKVDILQIAEEL